MAGGRGEETAAGTGWAVIRPSGFRTFSRAVAGTGPAGRFKNSFVSFAAGPG